MAPVLTASLWLLAVLCSEFVSADQNIITVKAEPGEIVNLPCRDPDRGGVIVVEWSRTDLGSQFVLLYKDKQINPDAQHPSYKDRVDLLVDRMKVGDASLVLENTATDDSGTYECRVVKANSEKKLISTVILDVAPPPPPEQFTSLAKFFLVLLVLAVIAAAAGLAYYFWRRSRSVPQVEVDSGAESVLLPFTTTPGLPGDARVEWRDRDKRIVHVYQNGSDQPEEQDRFYRTRTRMNEDLLKTGDLSLTLEWPTDGDTFTCSVSRRDGDVLMEKQVQLEVKEHQVEVKEGAESVLLPFTTTPGLPKDAEVRWWDSKNKKVHVYQNGSDLPGKQNQLYRTRTRMNEDLLETGDLSLTLSRPTERDSGRYECRVWREGAWLRRKTVRLTVKGRDQDQPEDTKTRLMSNQSV